MLNYKNSIIVLLFCHFFSAFQTRNVLCHRQTLPTIQYQYAKLACVTCWAEEQTIAAKMPHFCACLHRFDSSDLPLVTMKGHLLLIYTWKFWAELPRYFSLIYCSCECDFLEIQLEPTSIGVTELRGQRTEKTDDIFPCCHSSKFWSFC